MKRILAVTFVILFTVSSCSLNNTKPSESASSDTGRHEDVQASNNPLDENNQSIIMVNTVPEGAQIRFKHYSKPFENGMTLPHGTYTLIIEKPGYETVDQNVAISGIDMEMNVELKEIEDLKFSLRVKPDQEDCRIRIKNIKEKYKDGILLENGKYLIEVQKKGFEVCRKWIVIDDVDSVVNVKLRKAIPRYTLMVKPNVDGARIRIMNIRPKYKDNIKLPKGRYFIDIQKIGYQTFQAWVNIVDQPVVMEVEMVKF